MPKGPHGGRRISRVLRGVGIRLCLRQLRRSRSRFGQRLWFALFEITVGTPDDNEAFPQFATMRFLDRDRTLPEGPALTEHEAYLKAMDYATEAGLEGPPVGRYVMRMIYDDYAAATGQRTSEEVLSWDVWAVALAGDIEYRQFGSEHMPDDQRTFDYVAIALEAVGGEVIRTAFYADGAEWRPFPVE